MPEHDPDLALSFYYDSGSVITNVEFRSQFQSRDEYFEFNLIGQIADKNAAKAVQFGLRSLEKGLQYQHVDLLRKIYEKDADKGIEFGSALLSKAKSVKAKSSDFYIMNSLLEYGAENLEQSTSNRKKPIFDQQQLRELAETFGRAILNQEGEEISNGMGYVTSIERFSPAYAARIKTRIQRESRLSESAFGNWASNGANRANRSYSNSNTMSNANYYSNSAVLTVVPNPNQVSEEKLENDIKQLAKGELPKAEREKVVAHARKILMQTPGKDKKIVGLSMLAAQVSRAGDKELAAEIMRDAEALVNPNPKHYQDFIFTWVLAGGYAESDPDKAFPILEDAIGRANNLITAFISVGEFIDVAEEMISDGEVQVGAFGGGMIRGLSKELGIAEVTINTLVKADFAKTKGLTNRFDRPEVRVLAKMLVLRAVLGKKPEPKGENGLDTVGKNLR